MQINKHTPKLTFFNSSICLNGDFHLTQEMPSRRFNVLKIFFGVVLEIREKCEFMGEMGSIFQDFLSRRGNKTGDANTWSRLQKTLAGPQQIHNDMSSGHNIN